LTADFADGADEEAADGFPYFPSFLFKLGL